jgi:hypothetical protein
MAASGAIAVASIVDLRISSLNAIECPFAPLKRPRAVRARVGTSIVGRPHLVMAGLDPAIHVFVLFVKKEDVDARDKRGHDGIRATLPSFCPKSA